MATREDSVAATRKELEGSFNRLKEGNPIRIKGSYRISPSKVEQEAGKPTSTIYQRPYKALLLEIKRYKAKKDADERGLENELDLISEKLREKSRKLAEAEENVRLLRKENADFEEAFKKSLGECADIISWLIKNVPEDTRSKLVKKSFAVSDAGHGKNVISIATTKDSDMKK